MEEIDDTYPLAAVCGGCDHVDVWVHSPPGVTMIVTLLCPFYIASMFLEILKQASERSLILNFKYIMLSHPCMMNLFAV